MEEEPWKFSIDKSKNISGNRKKENEPLRLIEYKANHILPIYWLLNGVWVGQVKSYPVG
jgi:hypothetical protein